MFVIAACGSPGSATGDGPGGDDDDGPGSDGPGTGDAPPDPCEPGTWCIEDSPVPNILLRAVWAADLDNVFAVGDGGTILHRRANVWTAMTTPTTSDLSGLWGLSATDIWAAGEDGALLHYDGDSWTAQGSFSTDFGGIWASGTDDVWITHAGGVTHWNGQQFDTTALPGELFAISGSGPTDVWVTGETANVHHYTGTWTTSIDPGAGATYFAILAFAPADVWVSTFTPNKQTVHFTGSWTPEPATGTTFQSFHPINSDDIWAAGSAKAGHWTGSSWAVETPAGNNAQMFGIGGIGGSFWIVGSNALILHRR